MMPQSPSKKAPWDLTQFSHCSKHSAKSFVGIVISCPILFSWISSMVWNLFPFKGDFNFGKSQKSQGIKSGLYGGWVTWVIWCFAKKLCMRRDAWTGTLLRWSCQPLAAHSCDLLNHLNRLRWGMFKLTSKFGADSLLYSLSHFECDGHTVHVLTQWHLLPPTDEHSEVIIVRACALQSSLLGCRVTGMLRKPFLLY